MANTSTTTNQTNRAIPPPANKNDNRDANPAPAKQETSTELTVRVPASKRRLEPELVARFQGESLDELRRLALQHGQNHWLTAEHCLELDQIYKRYQREIHIMALTNKLAPGPALQHLGDKTRFRDTKNSNERSKLTGALWDKLNKKEKAKYRDPDYLATFPNPYIHIQEAAQARLAARQSNVDSNGVQLGPKSSRKQHFDFKPEQWAKMTLLDLKRIGQAYQAEGFMVFVTWRGKRTIVTAGGGHLGQQYFDMTEVEEETTGPIQDFCEFVNGQRVIKKLTGLEIPASTKPRKPRKGRVILADGKYDKGSKKLNLADVREKLGAALTAATSGRYMKGWPGETKVKLKELGVQLRVQDNDMQVKPELFCGRLSSKWDIDLQHMQVAIGEGWMQMTGTDCTGDAVDVIGSVPNPNDNAWSNPNDDAAANPDGNSGSNPDSNNSNGSGSKSGEKVSVSNERGVKRCGGKISNKKPSKRSRTSRCRKSVELLEEEEEELDESEESEKEDWEDEEEDESDDYDDDSGFDFSREESDEDDGDKANN
ncbi:hypothetical protein PCANC_14488 [Puccinia coronata f. sp. avenae]|uniref:Uncharacterized protein n=1 Tax=Puccinia coronata f. sp. avenae TaxID=200324 RepID=A0A2N5SLY5_9BASI|nr:hypothetical protein PCANC_14488 [Puccinia coronata f. sp. avenae]